MIDPVSVRRASEAALARAGARVNADLPVIAADKLVLRSDAEVARRALALSVLARAAFGWPRDVALRWLDRHGLAPVLQPDELAFLRSPQPMSERDRWLGWHAESIGMAAWVGGLARDALLPWSPLPDATSALFPDPYQDASPDAFLAAFRLRSLEDIHLMLDLYFRAHWHARQAERDGTPDAAIAYAPVQFRRLMLEWTCNAGVDWHDIALET